ncbi:MAG TPA: phospholipase D-like domain-containing protein [Planosporangium sp.]|nr:phospholipase D-like domain-containing protein [Planosporangium sp.]
MRLDDWFLLPRERGNAATSLDSRHPDGAAWTTGNRVRPLVHGRAYFAELLAAIRRMRAGDLLMFTDWRGDPDERLDGPGTEVGTVLCEAARRGVVVKGLIWRSHLDTLQFSEAENRHLGEEIEQAGGECLLDMRVRTGGSHHQKLVVLRHPGRPELDVAYVGGIDLCHSRRDDASHRGDPQAAPMAAAYGPRPPWHDVQMEIRGPAVADVETVFRERWEDPAPLTRNPLHRLRDRLQSEDVKAGPLPARLPDPPACGDHAVQLLRTYPRRRNGYAFAPDGERSIARGYRKVLARAERLVYFEDQYLWSAEVVQTFAEALASRPELRLIAVVPRFSDQEGRIASTAQEYGRLQAVRTLYRAGGDRVAVYCPENHEGTPVYVHAKVVIVDDVWAMVGSDNVNLRSWTYDSELSCAVLDEAGACARELRLTLAREHLDRADGDDGDLRDPAAAFDAFAASARKLDDWYAEGRVGPRPAGRLRGYQPPVLKATTAAWARPVYRLLADPDGRPAVLRRRREF